MNILINIDVPDLGMARTFYSAAFSLRPGRRLGPGVLELTGWDAPVYRLERKPGTIGAGRGTRCFARHWTPIHIDVVVTDLTAALSRTVAAGAVLEGAVLEDVWDSMATLADSFGHGFCLIEFHNRGYAEIAEPTVPLGG